MKVLAFASHPVQAAATRYRLYQFVDALAERGITLSIRPLFDAKLYASLYRREALLRTTAGLMGASLLRFKDVLAARDADVVLIQREAMIFGPPVIEWLSTGLKGRPMVLDLDDATYIPHTSELYGRLGSRLKWFSKTDDLIRWASIVTCGNGTIAEYVTSKGGNARVIPTVVDTEAFHPSGHNGRAGELTIGWIGTHSTFPYLESIFPVLRKLRRYHRFRLKIVGAGRKNIQIPGVEIDNVEWQLKRELEDFQSLDIGLYPLDPADQRAAGKSGFKAILYMSVGIPYVAAPVGAVREIGEEGVTHFCATTHAEWFEALATLISNYEKRRDMGAAGRLHAVKHYRLSSQADRLAEVLAEAAQQRIQPAKRQF
jgi:glycosyltransferase involved in cell wall biosynthesis